MSSPLWTPSTHQMTHSHMAQFSERCGFSPSDYTALYQWSVEQKASFWEAVWAYCDLQGERGQKTLVAGKTLREDRYFVDAELNYALNCLSRDDEQLALVAVNEQQQTRSITYHALREQVFATAHYLSQQGVVAGDRVAGFMPNTIDTVVAMLATTLIGGVWSSCSPDFGLNALIDRFGQIEPKILFACTEHTYAGKSYQHQEKIEQLAKKVPSIQEIIWISPSSSLTFPKETPNLKPFPFNHPAFILYSSGTTGKPKCMVHGAGNTLIQHKKELMLHSDLHANDVILFYTTCGWMMWNWLISSLSVGATLVLYDGSPFHPSKSHLFELIEQYKITHFGCGAKFLESTEKNDIQPNQTIDLGSLRVMLTTGSTLLPRSFYYVYRDIKPDVQLSSISGGSDIISCFALGNPCLPVYRGELQCAGLGMDIRVFDDAGNPLKQQKGELVCLSSFPSMPLYFWDDTEGEKYQQAYFNTWPDVWAHGDYAEITTHDGLIIYGRSDATLNPGGIRIGTAEIYRQLDKIPEILDSAVVGKKVDDSEQVILFVVLKPEQKLDDSLIQKIQQTIRDNTSPHHVPKQIHAVPDLPRTISGKVSEIAIKKTINGETIKNKEALANPEVLKLFYCE